jgi:hypothetical protein
LGAVATVDSEYSILDIYLYFHLSLCGHLINIHIGLHISTVGATHEMKNIGFCNGLKIGVGHLRLGNTIISRIKLNCRFNAFKRWEVNADYKSWV